jgi:hypothetical protein
MSQIDGQLAAAIALELMTACRGKEAHVFECPRGPKLVETLANALGAIAVLFLQKPVIVTDLAKLFRSKQNVHFD